MNSALPETYIILKSAFELTILKLDSVDLLMEWNISIFHVVDWKFTFTNDVAKVFAVIYT